MPSITPKFCGISILDFPVPIAHLRVVRPDGGPIYIAVGLAFLKHLNVVIKRQLAVLVKSMTGSRSQQTERIRCSCCR